MLDPIGAFAYTKDGSASLYRVQLHLVAVVSTTVLYPERGVRRLQWVHSSAAPFLVGHPALGYLLSEVLSERFKSHDTGYALGATM